MSREMRGPGAARSLSAAIGRPVRWVRFGRACQLFTDDKDGAICLASEDTWAKAVVAGARHVAAERAAGRSFADARS